MSADLAIVHLYPELLRTYGDRGNVLALERRAQWRGFSVDVVPVTRGDAFPGRADVVLIGGGTDRVQEAVADDLLARGDAIAHAAAAGTIVLGVCGGYQFLAREYVAADGTAIRGLGLLDATTVAGRERLIGRVRGRAELWGRTFDLTGFENHGGRTTLGAGASPLARLDLGGGNDGEDGTEGAVQGNVLGTYLHGPVLPSNPDLADAILERALAGALGGEPLAPLEDDLERRAHEHALSLAR